MPKKPKDTKKATEAPKTDWRRVDAMTDEEITRRAKADPNAQPVPDEWFERAAKKRAARKAAAE